MANKPRYIPPSDVAADRRSITDQFGRRIGHMWPEDLEAYLKASYGDGWIAKFSRYAGISRDTLDLYRKGTLPIPKPIAQLVLMIRWYAMNTPKEKKRRKVELETPWLDVVE